MNSSLKSVIIFVSGAAVGATSMYFGLKKYFEVKADLEIENVRAVYNKKLEEIVPVKTSIEDPEVKNDAEIGRMGNKSSIVKELNNKPPLTSYSSYYKPNGAPNLNVKEIIRDPKEEMIENELAGTDSPPEDEPYTDEEDEAATADYEMYKINEEHKKAIEEGRLPYVIDRSDFELTCSHYSKITLHYYISDDVLTSDEDEILNPIDVIGDCLVSSGFSGDEEDILYVRNDIRSADYEIEKIFSVFTGE
jgi:hypothetical protein